MSDRTIARQGFTLVELLLSMIITVTVGAALVRLTLGQVRFMDQQEATREARSVSRSGINRLLSDLRAVETTQGLVAAAAGGQDFTVRVPYAFGVVCAHAANITTASILPVDAAMYAEVGYTGYAWRGANGAYVTNNGTALPAGGNALLCDAGTQDKIVTLPALNGAPAGQVVQLAGTGIAPAPVRGTILYLYRRVRYEFKASVALPGRIALWRTLVTTNTSEELAAPFDATARVNFYVLANPVAQAAVPAPLTDVRGLELVLTGMSERAPGGTAAPKTSPVTTSVFFQNRPD